MSLQVFSFCIQNSNLLLEILVVVFSLLVSFVELSELLSVVFQNLEQLLLLITLSFRLFDVDIGFLLNLHLLVCDVFLDLLLDSRRVVVLVFDLLIHQICLLRDFLH